MLPSYRRRTGRFAVACTLSALGCTALAQSTSGTLTGTARDTSGAVIPGAVVVLANPVSGYSKTVTSDAAGHFVFPNVALDRYQLSASSANLQAGARSVQIASVPS